MRTVFMHSVFVESWALMPEFISRVVRFCSEVDCESNPNFEQARVVANYVNPVPRIMGNLWLDGDKVVGHSLVSIENYDDQVFLFVKQRATDKGYLIPGEIVESTMKAYEAWGKQAGATKWKCIAVNPTVARAFRRYGFAGNRVMLEREVPNG